MQEEEHRGETQVLKDLARGSEKAFTLLYDRYWYVVYVVALKHLGSRDAALDTVQDVFTTVWNKHTMFAGVLSFRYYLITMAKHAIYRKITRQVNIQRADEEFALNHTGQTATDDHVLEADYQELVTKALTLLTPQQQQIFHLARVEGLSHKQIAVRLNLSHLTVKSHMNNALSFLRKHLKQHLAYIVFLLTIH